LKKDERVVGIEGTRRWRGRVDREFGDVVKEPDSVRYIHLVARVGEIIEVLRRHVLEAFFQERTKVSGSKDRFSEDNSGHSSDPALEALDAVSRIVGEYASVGAASAVEEREITKELCNVGREGVEEVFLSK
jgi:hypothetical protein